jgi:hypothetical protein
VRVYFAEGEFAHAETDSLLLVLAADAAEEGG